VDQLPSIGPGRVLFDLIESGKVPVVRLTTIFRQASDSKIPYVARDVNSGIVPDLAATGDQTDCVWAEASKDLADTIVRAVTTLIPTKRGIPSHRIQVLCPQHGTEIGCTALNNRLQQELNPNWTPDKKDGLLVGKGYRVFEGDRVIHANKNNYQLEVANGEIGTVVRANYKGFVPGKDVFVGNNNGPVQLVIDFGDRKVGFRSNDTFNVELAYAITIHKSQGSSFEAVVLPIHKANKFMLTRPLVYTAITRAEKLLVMLGETEALNTSVNNVRGTERNTSLKELLIAE
jgi:exodeoxyribonuclease V alpha subunit